MTNDSKREGLIRAVQAVTWNASNYPEKAQPHILGQDVVPLTLKIVDAVEAVFEQAYTPSYNSVVEEIDGLIDSLDEDVTLEDVGLALGELRANVFERAKIEKAHARKLDASPEPVTPFDDERTPEFEALEQDLFKHQPVLSMSDGSIAGCQCMDRVFYKRTEDWGTHLAEVFEALRRTAVQEPSDSHDDHHDDEVPEPQGEPSDAQVKAAAREYHERGNGEGSFDRMADHVRTSLLFRMGCALRAAGGAR